MHLTLDTVTALPDGVRAPTYDRADLTPGIVHIGLGNFHRAHQAWYLHRLMDQGQGCALPMPYSAKRCWRKIA